MNNRGSKNSINTVDTNYWTLMRPLMRLFRHGVLLRLQRFQRGYLTVIEGENSWTFGEEKSKHHATVTINDQRFYSMIAISASLGAAEAYIREYWTTNDLVSLFRILIKNQGIFTRRERLAARFLRTFRRVYHRLRDNSLLGSKRNIVAHYDLSNDFYKIFLDHTMTYSCAVFKRKNSSLAEASIEKLDRICRKLQLTENDHILEIGSGWGSFAIHAVQNYGCRVTTTTISNQQYEYCLSLFKEKDIDNKITLLNKDYRELTGQYDKLVSIEMIEAVGLRHIPDYISKCSELLVADGIMALQAITISDQFFEDYRRSVDFIQAMVFPGACLVSASNLVQNLKLHSDFRIIELEDITVHYAQTLNCWRKRFLSNLDEVRKLHFTEDFIRLWDYYLAYCEAGFLEAHIGDWQLLLAKPRYHITGNESERI